MSKEQFLASKMGELETCFSLFLISFFHSVSTVSVCPHEELKVSEQSILDRVVELRGLSDYKFRMLGC